MALDPNKNIPSSLASDDEWIQWHKALKSYYGGFFGVMSKEEINIKFLQAFEQRAGDQANTYALSTYAQNQGFTIDRGISAYTYDAVAGTYEGIGSGFMSIGTLAVFAVLLVTAGIGYTIYSIMKD